MKYSSEMYKTKTEVLVFHRTFTLSSVVYFYFLSQHSFVLLHKQVTYCSESYTSSSLKLSFNVYRIDFPGQLRQHAIFYEFLRASATSRVIICVFSFLFAATTVEKTRMAQRQP
jgi:hypothetical protein